SKGTRVMFCPNCSQQQASNQARFCSRCGFPLGGVTRLLENGGEMPVPVPNNEKPKRSPRMEGFRQGMILIFICFILLPFVDVLGHKYEEIPLVFMMAGLMRMLYARMFQEGKPKKTDKAMPANAYTPPMVPDQATVGRAPLLQAGQPGAFIDISARKVETSEIVQPSSVTENTTKLLEQNPE